MSSRIHETVHGSKVRFTVSGTRALFTIPENRIEKISYQIPTYEALRGVARSIYWKPTIIWVIDRVRVMNPIRTRSMMMNIDNWGNRTQAIYTYLTDVSYQVDAHFEWNMLNTHLENDRILGKHLDMFNRSLKRGSRRDVYLGTRECNASCEQLERFGFGEGVYDNYGELDFGLMYHGIDHPEETGDVIEKRRMFRANMVDGVIEFPHPFDCPIHDAIKKHKV